MPSLESLLITLNVIVTEGNEESASKSAATIKRETQTKWQNPENIDNILGKSTFIV